MTELQLASRSQPCSQGAGVPCPLGCDAQRNPARTAGLRRIRRGNALYTHGDRFRSLYVVRCGTFKSVASADDGREQVTGFRMASELLGLDGLAQGEHASTAVALEDSEVVAVAYSASTSAAEWLHEAVFRQLGQEIVRGHKLVLLLGSGLTAEQRLASFLLNLAQRMQARGWSGCEFHLRMSRADIASYLGLTLETVSRTFSAFQERGWLRVHGRHVSGLDRAALAGLFARA